MIANHRSIPVQLDQFDGHCRLKSQLNEERWVALYDSCQREMNPDCLSVILCVQVLIIDTRHEKMDLKDKGHW